MLHLLVIVSFQFGCTGRLSYLTIGPTYRSCLKGLLKLGQPILFGTVVLNPVMFLPVLGFCSKAEKTSDFVACCNSQIDCCLDLLMCCLIYCLDSIHYRCEIRSMAAISQPASTERSRIKTCLVFIFTWKASYSRPAFFQIRVVCLV